MPNFCVVDSNFFIDAPGHPYAIAAAWDKCSFILLETKHFSLEKAKGLCEEASKRQDSAEHVWGWVVESVFNAGGYVAGDGYGSLVYMPMNEEECPKNMSEFMYQSILLAKRSGLCR